MSIPAFWKAKWNVLRAMVAAGIVWALAVDTAPRMARLQLASLPGADYAAMVENLTDQGRYAEALVIADAGLASAPAGEQQPIKTAREHALERQQSLVRRLSDLARGAIKGAAGDARTGDASLELLLGAVATDLFVVGDIRDLIIQGGRWARGDETDPVIAGLAGVGLATTFAPEIDWAPSVLKAARKCGALPVKIGEFILSSLKTGNKSALKLVVEDAATIAKSASPAGAVRLLRRADGVEDLAAMARFLERSGGQGAHALATLGDGGLPLVRAAESMRTAGKLDDAARIERIVLSAAAKGPAGARFIERGWHRVLLRPHPLVAILKSVYKGNAQALIARLTDAIDPYARWMLPGATAWLFIELSLVFWRFSYSRRRSRTMPARARPA